MAASEGPLACEAAEETSSFGACHRKVRGSLRMVSEGGCPLGHCQPGSSSEMTGNCRRELEGPAGSLSLGPSGTAWRGN